MYDMSRFINALRLFCFFNLWFIWVAAWVATTGEVRRMVPTIAGIGRKVALGWDDLDGDRRIDG